MSGVLVRGGRGTAPLPGRWVVLHQVTMRGGGPVDSVRSDAAGRFRLHVPRVDTLAVYVASAFHNGLAYFSQPIRVLVGRAATADTLVVYDTSSSGPAVRLRRRLLTVAKPKEDGARDVLEILELENPGRVTRVAPDTLRPTWAGMLPPAALQFQVGTGDFSADAVARRGDSVLLFAPLQPDGVRQLSYGYVLPGSVRAFAVPIDQPTDELDLLIEDTLAVVSAPVLRPDSVTRIENRDFSRYRTGPLQAGALVAITFPAPPVRLEKVLPLLVGVIVVVMGAGLWFALRGKPQTSNVGHQN